MAANPTIKKGILINDSRLTPTMSRVRNGRKQVFTQKESKAEIVLQHDKKSMYAELINGEWYWVEGCAECKGKPRDWMTYIECEEHDRCRSCGTNRKDIKETPWGGKYGWQCQPCANDRKKELRKQAFEKYRKEGYDEHSFTYMNEIKCPHCASEISSDEMHESQDIECEVCEGQIHLEVEWTPSYSTSIKGERVIN